MIALRLAWLTFLWLSSASHYTQADFDGALKSHNLGLIRDILAVCQKDAVDPSVNNCEVLHLACDERDTDLVEMLLADERIDPSSGENEALRRAAKFLHHETCILLLRDPRVSADLIFDTPWIHQAINPNFIRQIRDIPKDALCACANGNVWTINGIDLAHLQLEHLDVLLERAHQHPGVRRILHGHQLRLLGAPFKVYSDASILEFVISLNTRNHVVIKRALRIRSYLGMTLKMLPAEIINVVAKQTFLSLLSIPLISHPPRKPKSRPNIFSLPPTSLFTFMVLDNHLELSHTFQIFKWAGRCLVIWNLISLGLAVLPFNRAPVEGVGPMKALYIWLARAFVNFLILIALPNYMLK